MSVPKSTEAVLMAAILGFLRERFGPHWLANVLHFR